MHWNAIHQKLRLRGLMGEKHGPLWYHVGNPGSNIQQHPSPYSLSVLSSPGVLPLEPSLIKIPRGAGKTTMPGFLCTAISTHPFLA